MPEARTGAVTLKGNPVTLAGPEVFRERAFGPADGVQIKDGTVTHVEYVKEIASEPNYETALQAAKKAAG